MADALKSFELANQISATDEIFKFDPAENKRITNLRPWKNDPHHFKKVKISAVALVKMVMHARSGGQYEIMGLMQGKITEDGTFIIIDSFALPVVGTETRVNAGAEADEFMVQYKEAAEKIGRTENIVGWYHSHPGYGCWLSGIDVSTQHTNQRFQDPFLAIVIDPNRTISAGKVEIGAFRTYPENYTPPNEPTSEYQSVPLSKIEDFGVHSSRYYQLDIEYFKSSLDTAILDLLWNKYWATTLSQSPLISNRAYTTSQISDLAEKLSRTDNSVQQKSSYAALAPQIIAAKKSKSSKDDGKEAKIEETALAKIVKDGNKISHECQCGLIAQTIKDVLFANGRVENLQAVANN